MKRSRRTKSDLIIDLTSLLDVVFILLLILVFNINEIKGNAENEQNQAHQLEHDASEALNTYTTLVDTAKEYNMYIAVTCSYDEEAIYWRTISVSKNGEPLKSFDISGTNTSEQLAEFDNLISSYIEESISAEEGKSRPVVLALNDNDDEILYRDELAIESLFDKYKDTYPNVYVR